MIEANAANESVFRCGQPSRSVREWLARHGSEDLRIATYGVSRFGSIGHFIPQGTSLELLVGISFIDPLLVGDLHETPEHERWHRLLDRLGTEDQNHLLRNLRKLNGWRRTGARVRIALPGPSRGLMHLKLYLGKEAALVGSANLTLQAIEGADQHELLLELAGKSVVQLQEWWRAVWATAWPVFEVGGPVQPIVPVKSAEEPVNPTKENSMNSGQQMLLGYWLGEWGAWALNAKGMLAYPHQLQAVEWIRPDAKAYLLGDEVGLGKTFTAAFLWIRHRQLYGDKARLIYITKPSLLVDALSAFVSVLGVDEFLHSEVEIPQRAGEVQPRFSIFHASTRCWEMVADEDGRKRNKDHQVAGLLKEGRFRMRPAAFQEKIQWLRARTANSLHEEITITAVQSLVANVYTFVSIDTLRNPDKPLANVFAKLDEAALVPLVIVDESHGLGRTTLRRAAIADLVWGPGDHAGKLPILKVPGALVVYMTGTPVHPNESETASRLGLLDVDPTRTPHKPVLYENARSSATRAILDMVRDRAVIRRKEGITLDGKPNGLRIFPKRLVFPFQKWMSSTGKDTSGRLPKEIAKASKDILIAIDQYVASEASHGAKLFSLIRRVLRSAREWKEIRQLIGKDPKKSSGEEMSFGERVLRLTEQQIKSTSGDQQKRWKALRIALEAARNYEEKLKDERLENLTWKRGDDDGNEVKQMLFTKAGWVATAYDSLAKGGKKAALDATEEVAGDIPEEDEETAGDDLFGYFDSADDMLDAAERAKRLAETYLDPVLLDDDSKVRFSMLVALLEGIASLKVWPKRYPSMEDEDRFGWGIEDADEERLRKALEEVHSESELLDPWVVHARYIHSVVDTAVRLQLRYGREAGVPIVGIIIGDTPNQKRDEIKERFSKGELNIVCMSDAGAEGINLQRSNKIVLLDVPVSPGRIEQIAGRVHRLGSVRAAQVTLLLPPGYFGTKVFESLRKAASNVYKMVAGSNLPAPPPAGADHDAYYVRQLAEYEARLLTAVAETSGVIRSEENRGALEQLVCEPERHGQAPNTASIEKVLKSGFDLIKEQRQRFQQGDVATHSDLMPNISDLVEALVKFEGATTAASSDTFRVPVRLIDDRTNPDEYGDLVTQPEPFQTLQLKTKYRYWYSPQRFLPTDLPTEENFQ